MSVKTIPAAQIERFGPGRVVAVREENRYHDSYFRAIVAVDAEDGGYRFETVETGATAYAGGFVAVEDATEDVLVNYRARRDEVMANLAADRADREARMVEPGKDVVVVKAVTRGKNKVAAGVTGRVMRREVNAYDSRWAIANDRRSYRVRVVLDDEERVVWVDEDKVRVAGFEDDADLPDRSMAVDYVIAGAWPDR